MARKVGPLGPAFDVIGEVAHYSQGEQGGEQFRWFLVREEGGTRPVPVELSGERISGPLADGHRVAIVANHRGTGTAIRVLLFGGS